MSVLRELRDAAELLEGRIARLQRELARPKAAPASLGTHERREALRTAQLELERRREELARLIYGETATLLQRRAVHEALHGWETTPNDSGATQDEVTGAALGCAAVVGPLLLAQALLQAEEPWLRSAVVLLVLVVSLAVAARQGFRAGRGLRRLEGETRRGSRGRQPSRGFDSLSGRAR